MGWRAAGPAPSFPPALSNRNLLQCCGERRGRGARGLAGCGPGGPRLAGGRRDARRAACSLARSLAPSLPPSAGGFVSQSASSRRARAPQRARDSALAPPPAIVRWAAAAAGAGPRAPEPPVRRGGGGGARAALGGAELSLRGRSWRPRRRRRPFVSSPLRSLTGGTGSTASARRRLRGWSSDAAGPSRKRRGLRWGSVSKLGLGYIFDEGKSARSGLSIMVQWAGALEGNQTGELQVPGGEGVGCSRRAISSWRGS